ncbi:carbamoyltransferase [Phytohabitans aurantiacus]|uniref:Carbamoyltransferase n=1 Tax=Phytohabitans aurantiacus TaxID=3016789 RepID=A0ABQ5QZY8_9ACTN|nr:carbamoyltransferase [Phytohabitans aurantiacus]
MMTSAAVRGGLRIALHGVVQGVGFRPFVYRTAVSCGLTGDVRNTSGHVEIHAFGSEPALAAFLDRLAREAPAEARIDRVETSPLDAAPPAGFGVRTSSDVDGGGRESPPDLATCDACLRELFDPLDRRYRYPFINCTDCGPRATIVADLPYDRSRTTMSGFPMCPACAAEYRDPADRRFHAEPIACPACGPRLCWRTVGGGPIAYGEDALAEAVAIVDTGGVIAVKGIGGYQIVCDAQNEAAVARVRAGKCRPRKPLAVMVPDVDDAARLGFLGATEVTLLTGTARPIVLVWRWANAPLADGVAPALPEVGVFLPYSPLHHLLLRELGRPLVVTSGNRGGEPIAIDPDTARAVLGPLTDGILDHDRPVLSRYDDSVARVVAGAPRLLRRARGYAPASLALPAPAPEPVLAVGAHLKHTAALAVGDRAVLGPHTGDLESAETFAAFEQVVTRLGRLWAVRPRIAAHDPHPGYLSTQYATARFPRGERVPVQHHHAHVVATAAEHGVREPFLGIAYDGLGYGDDGTLWGGEILLATYTGFRRVGRFGRAPLPGGAAAVRHPARMALGYLYGAEDLGGQAIPDALAAGLLGRLDAREVDVVRRMVRRGLNAPLVSSAGRLFDAVASLLGVADDAGYEGEAAILLEAAAAGHETVDALRWRLVHRDGLWVYDPAPTIVDALERAAGEPVGMVAARFHAALAEVTVAFAESVQCPTRTVCLGGGVFQNRRLAEAVLAGLRAAGFDAYLGERVPVNDGGISYGQAAVAAARLAGKG